MSRPGMERSGKEAESLVFTLRINRNVRTIVCRNEDGDWQATILAHDLKSFCLKFIDFIAQVID